MVMGLAKQKGFHDAAERIIDPIQNIENSITVRKETSSLDEERLGTEEGKEAPLKIF